MNGGSGGASPLEPSNGLPLQVRDIIDKARNSWLKNPDVVDILENFRQYRLAVCGEPPVQPAGGTLYLFNRKECRFFRKDGHNWRKKADGKTVRETHEKLKVGNEEVLNCYYAHADQDDGLQRRCYWLLDESREHIVLVHYLNCSTSRAAPSTGQGQPSAAELLMLQQARQPDQRMPRMPRRPQQQRPGAPPDRLRGGPYQQQLYDREALGSDGRRRRRSEDMDMDGSGSMDPAAPSGSLDGGLPSASDICPVSSGGLALPPHSGLHALQHQYALAAAAQQAQQAAVAAAQQAQQQQLQGQGSFTFPQHHPWQHWFQQQQQQQQQQRGLDGGSGGGFGLTKQELGAALAYAGQLGQHGPPHTGPPLPPHAARSRLHALSFGMEGDPQRQLFPQMSLGLSRLNNMEGNSLCQFLAELEQSLEHHQAQQMLALQQQQQPQPLGAGGPQTSLGTRAAWLQQWSEASASAGAGLAQLDPATNRALLSQMEAAFSAAAASSLPAPSWRQPELDIPPLDMAAGAAEMGSGPSNQGDPPQLQARPEFRNLLRLVSTAKSAQGRALFEGSGAEQSLVQRAASVPEAAQARPMRPPQPHEADEAGPGAEEGSMGEGGGAVPMEAEHPAAAGKSAGITHPRALPQRKAPTSDAAGEHSHAARTPPRGQHADPGLDRGPATAEAKGDDGLPARRRALDKQESFALSTAGPSQQQQQQARPPHHLPPPHQRPQAAGEAPRERPASPLLSDWDQQQQQQAARGGGAARAANARPKPGHAHHRASEQLPLHPQAARWGAGGAGAPPGRGAEEDGGRGGAQRRGPREAQVETLVAAAAALGQERREALMQQARFQRLLSFETENSIPVMIEQLANAQHLEDTWLQPPFGPNPPAPQQAMPPHQAARPQQRRSPAPDDAAYNCQQPGQTSPARDGAGRAAPAAAPREGAGAGASAAGDEERGRGRGILKERSIDAPVAAESQRPARQEGEEGPAAAGVAAEGIISSQQHALALIRQLNQLKEQVIQHLMDSGTVGPDVIDQLVSGGKAAPAAAQKQGSGGGGGGEQAAAQPSRAEPPRPPQQQGHGQGNGGARLPAGLHNGSEGGCGLSTSTEGGGGLLGEPHTSVTSLMHNLEMGTSHAAIKPEPPLEGKEDGMAVDGEPAGSPAATVKLESQHGDGQEAVGRECKRESSPTWPAFRVTDFTPDWDFTMGGAKMIITGAVVGNGAMPLFVWFGGQKAATTQVCPGVLRCTVPPAQSPGRVLLRIAPESAAAVGEGQDSLTFEYRPLMQRDSSSKQ